MQKIFNVNSPQVSADRSIDKIMPVRVAESSVPSQVSGANSRSHSPQVSSPLSVGRPFLEVRMFLVYKSKRLGKLTSGFKDVTWIGVISMVVTFWEGEIVDIKNYTFFTGKWEALPEDDIRHWTKFPSFAPFLSQVEADGGKSLDLSNYPFIFMRWKEKYFVNVGTDCGLTITGFYYVCFSCADVTINGFYYDPNSSPFQKLELKSANEGKTGFSFSSYEL